MVGEIFYNKKMVGRVDLNNKTFYTKRKPEHYFIKFGGFGISLDVLHKLKKHGIEKIVIDYQGKNHIRYATSVEKYLNAVCYFDNNDEQRVLNTMAMEKQPLLHE